MPPDSQREALAPGDLAEALRADRVEALSYSEWRLSREAAELVEASNPAYAAYFLRRLAAELEAPHAG